MITVEFTRGQRFCPLGEDADYYTTVPDHTPAVLRRAKPFANHCGKCRPTRDVFLFFFLVPGFVAFLAVSCFDHLWCKKKWLWACILLLSRNVSLAET